MTPCSRKWSRHRVRRGDKCSIMSVYRGKLTAGRGLAEEVAFGRGRMRKVRGVKSNRGSLCKSWGCKDAAELEEGGQRD